MRTDCKIVFFFSFFVVVVSVFFIIGFGKTQGADVTFSGKAACEPHTPIGLVSLSVFTLSLQTFRLTARAPVLNLDNRLFTVPYVFVRSSGSSAIGTGGPSRFHMYPGAKALDPDDLTQK